MTLQVFWVLARRRLVWFAALSAFCILGALLFYGSLSDRFVTEAVVTSKTTEDRSFDAGSLSGLAALAGGGQRPTFEQLGFLVQSRPVLDRILPLLRRDSPRTIAAFLGRSPAQQFRFDFEQAARSMFSKPPVRTDDTERLINAVRASLKVAKTPEGYLKLSFTTGIAEGQVNLVRGVLAEADAAIRARERIEYRNRVRTYQALIEEQTRTTERAILISLIGREYSNYVAAQSGQTFSFEYVEPPLVPRSLYSPSLLVVLILGILFASVLYISLIFALLWMRK